MRQALPTLKTSRRSAVMVQLLYGYGCSFSKQLWLQPLSSQTYRVMQHRWHCQSHSPHTEPRTIKQIELLDSLNTHQAGQVDVYIDCLLDWNQRMNLTAVTERCLIMERHIADSLALLPVLESTLATYEHGRQSQSIKVVDVGTGAGLPGIVLAIARPAWKITLLESLQKRCNFLGHVVETLSLNNVRLVRARAEDAGHDTSCREAFDVAVARAVAEMRVLVELCLPLVRRNGLMVAAKGANPEEEVRAAERAASLLGAMILPVQKVSSMSPHGQRTAILCYKERLTPKKYPRKPGTPQKQPL